VNPAGFQVTFFERNFAFHDSNEFGSKSFIGPWYNYITLQKIEVGFQLVLVRSQANSVGFLLAFIEGNWLFMIQRNVVPFTGDASQISRQSTQKKTFSEFICGR
jgi:hypothetical protein